jgi:hypothetical protein
LCFLVVCLLIVFAKAQWLNELGSWIRVRLCKLQKRCTQLAAASDKVYQLIAHGRWFSPGTPASSITKTGRHDIAEILLKVELSTIKSKKHIVFVFVSDCLCSCHFDHLY